MLSKLYTNVTLTVIAAFLGLLALRPFAAPTGRRRAVRLRSR